MIAMNSFKQQIKDVKEISSALSQKDFKAARNKTVEFVQSNPVVRREVDKVKRSLTKAALTKAGDVIRNKIGKEMVIIDPDGYMFKTICSYDEEQYKKYCTVKSGDIVSQEEIRARQMAPFAPGTSYTVQVDNFNYIFFSYRESDKRFLMDGSVISSKELTIFFIGKDVEKTFADFQEKYMSFKKPPMKKSVSTELEEVDPFEPKPYQLYVYDKTGRRRTKIGHPRRLDTIYTEDDLPMKVVTYIQRKISKRKEFQKLGVNFRTGILLDGAPGTGKSTTVCGIASYLGFNVVVPHPSCIQKCVEDAEDLINPIVPTIFLFEEIDKIFKPDDHANKTSENEDNENYLMQFLDGVISYDNIIIIATTNHKERLEENQRRSGRFDLQFSVNPVSRQIAQKMVDNFGADETFLDSYTNYINHPVTGKPGYINPGELQRDLINWKLGNVLEDIREETADLGLEITVEADEKKEMVNEELC